MISLVLLSALHFAPLPAQDPVEFGRLATEQRQVAEQVRRLGALLEILESRDREEGREERADLLASARERLRGAEQTGNLASVVEGVARELSSLHTGNALEGQAELIQVLQELLDFLVETERKERQLAKEKALAERLEALKEFVDQQKDLLERTEELKEQKDAETPDDASGSEAAPDPELQALQEELAELQNRLAQELNEFNREQEQDTGRQSKPAEEAEDATKEAAEKLRPKSAETGPQDPKKKLEEAIEKQKEALEKMQEAKEQAEDQQEKSDEAKRREALLNVMREAQIILDRHRSQEAQLAELVLAVTGDRVPRSARSSLRQVSLAERELSIAAEQLLLTIEEAGADSFPLYIHTLSQDHDLLAKEIGPPRYRLHGNALALAASLTADWEQLIEVIRIEQERIRKRLEAPDSQGSPQEAEDQQKEQPLVDFAMELQLLKRMQESVADRLSLLHQRLETYSRAGIELGPEESNELEMLLDRQSELHMHFDSMVRRLQGGEEGDQQEDV
ncbi:MAG: hypothetical protein ACYTEP_03725 [Planctomycetota bacterium]|jgi:hypothetical protein